MGLLTKDEIFKVNDIRYEEVDVPEWGGRVRVRGATAVDRDAYDQSMFSYRFKGTKTEVVGNYENLQARLVVKCVVDADGKRVFSDEDAVALGQKSAAPVQRIFARIESLSGMSPQAMGGLEGNSEAGPDGGSSSSSPAI